MELSIIAGNDFTAPFSQQLKERLGLRDRSHVTQIADWVREHGSLENHPGACELMVRVIIIIHVGQQLLASFLIEVMWIVYRLIRKNCIVLYVSIDNVGFLY